MATTLSGLSLSAAAPRISPRIRASRTTGPLSMVVTVSIAPWGSILSGRTMRRVVLAAAAPDSLEDKVVESIKNAEETCSEDPKSGECVAAWDEVEELSAAASHARDKKKVYSDPLENFCKDNPDDEECRTYDN
ncbi:hypothetical protein SAY87_021413 [Trapa incisa]|uniref:CP12 domain-containing protein n=1 Tax=Trapa incisa TaxID=236973 RepID=A0AAN7PW05_9MYRT|nr:hypothetical protein SAY87_021413 [Trapa incisa]